jgi:hypothetical protein
MPLSRHFYCLEEVQAALSYSTTKNQYPETLFWCEELIQSGCASEAISTLFESWVWQVGSFRLRWLVDSWKELESDEIHDASILLAAYRLSSLHASNRDQSLFRILLLTSHDSFPPDRVTQKSPMTFPSDDPKECYFVRSLYQKKAQCAWWMALTLSMPRRWELLEWYCLHVLTSFQTEFQQCLHILQHYGKLMGYQTDAYDCVISCLSIMMFCLTPKQQEDSFRPLLSSIDPRTQETMTSWQPLLGRKSRRIYTLPPSCLYGITQRGCMKRLQHNRIQLYHVEKYIIGCPFWDEALQEYATVDEGSVIHWTSEDKKEAFYVRYFPDDIPDEWNKEEKDRSHGDGILGSEESVTFFGYASRFFSKSSRLYWCTFDSCMCRLKEISFDEAFPQCMMTNHPISNEIDIRQLQPVRKIKRILSSS